MAALMELAVNILFGSIGKMLNLFLVNSVMSAMGWLNTVGTGFFDAKIIADSFEFSRFLSYLVFGATLIITFFDIVEDLSEVGNGKTIEFATIFMNLFKGLMFIEIAPVLAKQSIIVGADLSSAFNVDTSTITNGFFNNNVTLMLIILIASVSFFCLSLFSVGAMFLQAITVFLYVPDIVRGRTTSMGDWIRQTLSLLVTYMLRNILFFLGFLSAVNVDIITMAICWITMFGTARILQKFGISSGFAGAVSSTISMGQSAVSAVSSLVH